MTLKDTAARDHEHTVWCKMNGMSRRRGLGRMGFYLCVKMNQIQLKAKSTEDLFGTDIKWSIKRGY